MIKTNTTIELMQRICKAEKLYGIYISWIEDESREEVIKAAPYLDMDKNWDVIANCMGVIFFKTKRQCEKHFSMTKGDNRNKVNTYNGPARVYALTCNDEGILETSNT
jgi:hypothetical protein